VKVRIKAIPAERELDGVDLDSLSPGSVRDVSASLATWLIAEGYAELEMRQGTEWPDEPENEEHEISFTELPCVAHDRRRRR